MGSNLASYSDGELRALVSELESAFQQRRGSNLKLDLTRGKPAADQLSLSDALDGCLNGDYRASDGTDVRNYGGLRGLPEARALGAELMDVPSDAVIVGGNSSLQLMYIVLELGLQKGLGGGSAWSSVDNPTVICPVPGYDRHFTVCNELGLSMVTVPLNDDGPDMDAVRELAQQPNTVAMWNVPKYSNPTGITYSDAVVRALAELPTAAAFEGFTVLWDNAYAVHDFDADGDSLLPLHDAAERAGTLDRCVQFASTSKITFAGAGVSFIASGPKTLSDIEARLSSMTVGPDKVNQLRHARFLGGRLREHMAEHGKLVRPKFDAVEATLARDLGSLGIASWTTPRGGYFVSLDVVPGLAKEIVALAAEAGVTLTPAGATFPNGHDPEDRNIRIAPTFATLQDVETSLDVLTLCVRLASARALLEQRT